MKASKSKLLPRKTVKIAGGEIMDSNFNELDLLKESFYHLPSSIQFYMDTERYLARVYQSEGTEPIGVYVRL